MTISLTKNFFDPFYAGYTNRPIEGLPLSDWVILLFLDERSAVSFSTERLNNFLKSDRLDAKTFGCNQFSCTHDYEFRDSKFSKKTPFWVLYFKTFKPISKELVQFYVFEELPGIHFILPVSFRNDSVINFAESREEFIHTIKFHRDTAVITQDEITGEFLTISASQSLFRNL